jgi:hypothetical protein
MQPGFHNYLSFVQWIFFMKYPKQDQPINDCLVFLRVEKRWLGWNSQRPTSGCMYEIANVNGAPWTRWNLHPKYWYQRPPQECHECGTIMHTDSCPMVSTPIA